LAVARTGTLSAAAEQLGTEHTTAARHIHALEEELNSRLLHRSNSGYGVTEVGERLLAGAEAVESAYASAKAAANSEGQTIGGTVRIGTPDGFGSRFLICDSLQKLRILRAEPMLEGIASVVS
jgi:DNA-binding transcriptional LysR family regulator